MATLAAGSGLEGAVGHRSRQENCDISQTDFDSHDRMEEKGKGCSDVSDNCHLGVKGSQRGQQDDLPARAHQCLGLPMFCSPLA